jgi:predicted TPR repeat methyltransferase
MTGTTLDLSEEMFKKAETKALLCHLDEIIKAEGIKFVKTVEEEVQTTIEKLNLLNKGE